MFNLSHTMIRRFTVVAAVLVAVAVVSPLASAMRRTSLPCQPTAAHWITHAGYLGGVPTFEFVPVTRCTKAVPKTVPTGNCGAGTLPFPGWVQVTNELGIPYLVPTGSQSSGMNCAAGSTPSTKATQSLNEPLRSKSPYPGWVYVYDAQGVPTLEAISSYR